MFVLDTNACIGLIKGNQSLLRRLRAHQPGDVAVSAVTVAELEFGVEKSLKRAENASALSQFLAPLVQLPFDSHAAQVYGRVRAALEARGEPIGPLDTLIGAHSLSVAATLVTRNTREFKRVAGLRTADWEA